MYLPCARDSMYNARRLGRGQLRDPASMGLNMRRTRNAAGSIAVCCPSGRHGGCGDRVADSDVLQAAASGWLYDPELQGVILKTQVKPEAVQIEIAW